MREGGKPLPLAFQYLILTVKRPCDLNLELVSSLATKCQHFKLRKKDISTLKSWHFEASEDIITKFKSQGLYTIKIKY